ncbi:MAG: hypothetical protein IJ438_13050 [Clostridia bacterium]|nr:hypothetical protein [Clostridia bacterium]
MDRFLEEVVKKHKRTLDEILYYLSWVMMIVFALMGLTMLQFLLLQFDVVMLVSTLLFIGMAVYLFFTHDKLRTEYEYTFTNGTMDFAMVYNNKKRKSLGSLNVSKVDAFGKVASGSFRRHVSAPNVKQLRWFLNRDAELYYFAFSKDGKKSIIVMEPSEEMVAYIKHYLPYGAHQEN